MFVLCVLYIRGKRQRAGQSGRRTADKVKRENKKIPVGAIFSAPVHTGPGAHPSSYKMGTGYLSSGVNRPGRGVNHRPPHSAEVKERAELYLYSPSGTSWPVLGGDLFSTRLYGAFA